MLTQDDFNEIQDYLDNVFFKDEHSKEILEKSDLDKTKISIINTLIVNAIRAYDLKKQNEK